MRIFFCLLLACMLPAAALAEVTKSSSSGFIIQHSVTVSNDTARVFREMTEKVGSWWNPDHSFSANADALLIDESCYCERWGKNLVRHLDTTIWIENEKVVMHGGLGPLKELGLSGTMAWSLTPGEDAGTTISWKYNVFGYSETDLASLAVAVDGVLKEQIDRLAGHLAGKKASAASK